MCFIQYRLKIRLHHSTASWQTIWNFFFQLTLCCNSLLHDMTLILFVIKLCCSHPMKKVAVFSSGFFLSGQWKAHHSLSFFLNLQTSFVPGFLRQKTQVFSAIITEKALSRSNITQMLAADLRRRQRLLLTWALYSSYLILTFRMLGKLGIQTHFSRAVLFQVFTTLFQSTCFSKI